MKLFENKKAEALTLNTIIIAILVIFVLVVLIMIFTGRMGNFVTTTGSCENRGGRCSGSGCGDLERAATGKEYACTGGGTCCIGIKTSG